MNFERHKDPKRSIKIGITRDAIHIDHLSFYSMGVQMVMPEEMALDRLTQICHGPFPIPVKDLDFKFWDGPGKPMNYKKNDWVWAKEYNLQNLRGKVIIYANEIFQLPILWKEEK